MNEEKAIDLKVRHHGVDYNSGVIRSFTASSDSDGVLKRAEITIIFNIW